MKITKRTATWSDDHMARVRSLLPSGSPIPDIGGRVTTTAAFEALLYADEDGNFVLNDDGDEKAVPMPPGTLCEVSDVRWIGGSQGMAFYIRPIGGEYPDPVSLQIDEADLENGLYPFVVTAA